MNISYGGPTLAVAIVVGVGTVVLGWSRPFWVLSVLFLGVAFRDFGTRWLNSHTELGVEVVTAIGRWWFVAIAVLLAVTAMRFVLESRRAVHWPKPEPVDVAFAVVLVFALLATLASPERSAAVISLRGYLQPLGVYFLARAIRPSRRELGTLLLLWLIAGGLIAAFGLIQAMTWTEQDYVTEGYVRQNGELVVPPTIVNGVPYLRPASTVSGPNELGVDMVVMFGAAVFCMLGARSSAPRLACGALALLFLAGLASTLSRSAFLALLATMVGAAAISRRTILGYFASADRRTRLRLALGAAAGVTLTGAVLGGFGFFSQIRRTIAGLQGEYHFQDTVEAVGFLVQHPQGVGMGLVEPKGALSLIEAGGRYHVEGSMFQIAMETGVWGLVAWLAFWAIALARTYRNFPQLGVSHSRVFTGSAAVGWLGSLVAFLFLPLMQSISLMVWLWFLLGVGYQSRSFEQAWKLTEPAAAGG